MMANKKELKKLVETLKRKTADFLASRDKFQGRATDLKKEVKQLRDTLARERQAAAADRKGLQTRIDGLERDKTQLEQQLAKLRSHQATVTEPPPASSVNDSARGGVALAQRDSWKRAKFLQDRYEYHLEHKRAKPDARRWANRDLMERFGEAAGYSEEHLEEILF